MTRTGISKGKPHLLKGKSSLEWGLSQRSAYLATVEFTSLEAVKTQCNFEVVVVFFYWGWGWGGYQMTSTDLF